MYVEKYMCASVQKNICVLQYRSNITNSVLMTNPGLPWGKVIQMVRSLVPKIGVVLAGRMGIGIG